MSSILVLVELEVPEDYQDLSEDTIKVIKDAGLNYDNIHIISRVNDKSLLTMQNDLIEANGKLKKINNIVKDIEDSNES